MTIEIRDSTAYLLERLKVAAEAKGRSLDAVLSRALEQEVETPEVEDQVTDEEFEKLMDDFSWSDKELPVLPPTFSREDIYFDHD